MNSHSEDWHTRSAGGFGLATVVGPGSAEGTVLDEWIIRSRNYDTALRNLYLALIDCSCPNGPWTVEVQFADRDEKLAREQLPPDRRTIIVIVSEVTAGGLTEAVLAIDDSRGLIEDALAEAEAPGPGASPAVP